VKVAPIGLTEERVGEIVKTELTVAFATLTEELKGIVGQAVPPPAEEVADPPPADPPAEEPPAEPVATDPPAEEPPAEPPTDEITDEVADATPEEIKLGQTLTAIVNRFDALTTTMAAFDERIKAQELRGQAKGTPTGLPRLPHTEEPAASAPAPVLDFMVEQIRQQAG
jgi:hypothetical protein